MEDASDNASDFMYNCKVRNDKMQSNIGPLISTSFKRSRVYGSGAKARAAIIWHLSRVMSPGSGAAQDRSTNILNNYTTWTRKKRKLFSQSWTPHLSYFNFFFGCLFHLNKRYNFHFPHFKNISFHFTENKT